MLLFLYTSDWQSVMTRHFFSECTQESYSQARFDAIRTIRRVANEERCQFVLFLRGCLRVEPSGQKDGRTRAGGPQGSACSSVHHSIEP